MKATMNFSRVVKALILTLVALIIAAPVYVVIVSTFKTNAELFENPSGLPASWSFANYTRLFVESNIGQSFTNSVIVTGVSVIAALTLASLASFGITRLMRVSGLLLFGFFIVGLAIPAQVNIIPIFLFFKSLGLTNSLVGLIVINVVTTLPISVFILTTFFRQLPTDMFESAAMDGAGYLRQYFSIALPLSAPAMSATAIFLLVIVWNDLLYPLLLVTEESRRTLPLTLLAYQGEFFADYTMIFTGVLVASAPMVILYIALQRFFIAGLTSGAVKG
jgi:raffinose/stachyose/melibiose transport system permease protein